MKNTLENKAKFFGQYATQKICVYTDWPESGYHISGEAQDNEHLELIPLSQITDEHAIELARICSNYFPINKDLECEVFENIHGRKVVSWGGSYREKFLIDSAKETTKGSDFLRSKGYAIPYQGINVVKLISYGWINIKP